MADILPEVLRPGSVMLIGKGPSVTLVGTSKKDDFGQKLYRLHHPRRMDRGWVMPAITPKQTYSRDDLQAMGARIIVNPDYDSDEAIV